MAVRKVLLIGGSGFVGGWVASRLSASGVRVTIPTRRRENRKRLILLPTVFEVQADVNDPQTLADLIEDVDAVINLVGILHDRDERAPYGAAFAAAHVDLPRKIVAAMRAVGVRRLLHMSALRAAPDAPSAYLRSKADGEAAVLAAAGELDVTVFRPSVIFGPGDAFLNTFADLLRRLPALPLVGGDARLQPVFVGDVADAFVAALGNRESFGRTYELGGPRVYSLRELVRYVADLGGHPRVLVDVPSGIAALQACVLGWLPNPPLSPDNLRSLSVPSVTDGSHNPPAWQPHALEAVAPGYLTPLKLRERLGFYRGRAGRTP